jgi:NAD(P)-dependent dehydrogenase (short-subunit alcohol dehydrogenase family)
MLLSYKKMRIVPYPEREYGLCRCTGRFDTMIDFGGRRVVITGAGGGLGKALVSVFHRCDAFIVACDTDAADLSAEEIGERHRFDLLDEPAIRAACREICSAGAPAAFISNAGWTRAETLADLTDESLRKEMDLNFHGAAIMSRGLLPSMRNQPDGAAFVFVSSVNALAHYGNPAYSAAKAALHAWARALATEEGRNGIRANVVVPGSIRTDAWTHRLAEKPAVLAAVTRLYPLGRIVEPAEVAQAIAFLASPLASGITGAVLPVDAGISASNLPFLEQIAT